MCERERIKVPILYYSLTNIKYYDTVGNCRHETSADSKRWYYWYFNFFGLYAQECVVNLRCLDLDTSKSTKIKMQKKLSNVKKIIDKLQALIDLVIIYL